MLSGGVNLWLESAFNLKILTISTAMCKIFPFLSYTMLHYSVTIIVILTADKLYAVLSPFKAFERKFCKEKIGNNCFFSLISLLPDKQSFFVLTKYISNEFEFKFN